MFSYRPLEQVVCLWFQRQDNKVLGSSRGQA